mmetsp:Transcript_24409/g.43316  ORF Transcript_24409/g.43316 Transcript_24409/m.43316 type:complete len:152 (-) Transcript_24409:46-501(-)
MEEPDVLSTLKAQLPTIADHVKLEKCHHCNTQGPVIGCFPSDSCSKRFCQTCLSTHYSDDILERGKIVDRWQCPYKRKVCTCQTCSVRDGKVYVATRSQDIIQGVLDYNASLLLKLDRNRSTMSKQDVEYCLNALWRNLNNLAALVKQEST